MGGRMRKAFVIDVTVPGCQVAPGSTETVVRSWLLFPGVSYMTNWIWWPAAGKMSSIGGSAMKSQTWYSVFAAAKVTGWRATVNGMRATNTHGFVFERVSRFSTQ